MNNKVLVELIVPVLEVSYDIYVPINRKVGNLIILLSLCQRVVIENKQRKYRTEFRKIMGG